MNADQASQPGSPAAPGCVGVIGAGTMGAGIAQLAAQTGARTLLHDPIPEALESGVAKIAKALDRLAEKGRIEPAAAEDAKGRVEPVAEIAALSDAELVIEAAPEIEELKRELFGSLDEAISPDCIVATNTSSLSVTALSTMMSGPERFVGMHFFNPAPVMKLVEVVSGARSSQHSLAVTRALGEAMGKHVIDAADVAGFLVNRCNRPYSLESLKLLEERIADPAAIDRIQRTVGGFRMGSFELMDLIGIDTNHSVAVNFMEKSFGEPRYRPSPLAAAKIDAGELGRKSGRGWYSYESGGPHRPDDPDPPEAGGGDGRVLLIRGDLPAADELRSMAVEAGFKVVGTAGSEPWLTVDFGRHSPEGSGPRLRHLHDGSLHALDPAAAGFHLMPPLEAAGAIEFTATEISDPESVSRTEDLIRSLGRTPERVGDSPGLVLGRVVCQLINEAAFLIGEGFGRPDDVDAGLSLGVNHPRGPIAWSEALGLGHVAAVLTALQAELGEPRYRTAPLISRQLAVGGGLG